MSTLKPPAPHVNAVSIHEAGHAIISLVLRRSVSSVTVVRSEHVGGWVDNLARRSGVRMFAEQADGSFRIVGDQRMQAAQRTRARDFITILLAGSEAERQLVPDVLVREGDKIDRAHITALLPETIGSDETETQTLIKLERRTTMLVRKNKVKILRLASYFISNETLTGPQLRALWRELVQ